MNKKQKKIIDIDFNNLESIKKSERKKTKFENLGYTQTETIATGFNKFSIAYE